MIIDAHQHFWKLSRGDYGWLTPALTPLYRDILPEDLSPLLLAHGVEGTIVVQAAPTVAETEFLLRLAEETPFILGVVGWVDFASPHAPAEIARLAAHPKLVGLRPMIQDIADDDWMLRPDLSDAFDAMVAHQLTFDALVLPRHLPRLHQLLSRHPNLRTVIDHAAKPEISHAKFEEWAKDIALLAQESRAFCKFSGLLTEAGDTWEPAHLQPYIAHILKHFGADRLVWGSDWPVLNMAADYGTWINIAMDAVPTEQARAKIFGSNAIDLYQISALQ